MSQRRYITGNLRTAEGQSTLRELAEALLEAASYCLVQSTPDKYLHEEWLGSKDIEAGLAENHEALRALWWARSHSGITHLTVTVRLDTAFSGTWGSRLDAVGITYSDGRARGTTTRDIVCPLQNLTPARVQAFAEFLLAFDGACVVRAVRMDGVRYKLALKDRSEEHETGIGALVSIARPTRMLLDVAAGVRDVLARAKLSVAGAGSEGTSRGWHLCTETSAQRFADVVIRRVRRERAAQVEYDFATLISQVRPAEIGAKAEHVLDLLCQALGVYRTSSSDRHRVEEVLDAPVRV